MLSLSTEERAGVRAGVNTNSTETVEESEIFVPASIRFQFWYQFDACVPRCDDNSVTGTYRDFWIANLLFVSAGVFCFDYKINYETIFRRWCR